MPEEPDHLGETFAERLDWLFRTTPDPTGKPYSVRRVAVELTRRGCRISHTHLNNLRQGRAPDPRRSVVEAIAAFFGRPPSFFTCRPTDRTPLDDDLVHLLADPYVRQVARRLVDARLSPEGHAVVVAVIEQVRRLEVAAGSRRRDTARLTGS
ncbi:hypothetical protein O3597_09295 [Verrucosispora sp. WMMA2044]|uniref:XRE family transcriptional regulator n=1 Tax=Verrucosispora sioxanthis TaxID=2499994 RepID=A0A6M1LC92_9ACTN|nr:MULTISPECIES: XRE family transcriptional regulator [Micromonospora]NEE66798.1 XRE family transcriptional regulator [Verrucosispora sioxanthis]NGM15908.1 XRE family transcriptional regulator [Verrucosispora sioxanthis]WBB50636.1 hypothetical protein O3597_09295 [Verrucosispora sp. WMMA2044]